MPAYQSDAAPSLGVIKSYSSAKPCGAPTGYCREVPDVSADADPDTGLVIDWGAWGGWTAVGGTSLAAPHMGGADRAHRRLADLQRAPCRVREPGAVLDRREEHVLQRLERRDERRQPPVLDSQLVAVPGYRRI